ncbi:hypothetical protein NL676_036406 [Syzygium grande]|nr:hypothetical protein NL676_036406 [Syzygium grande]
MTTSPYIISWNNPKSTTRTSQYPHTPHIITDHEMHISKLSKAHPPEKEREGEEPAVEQGNEQSKRAVERPVQSFAKRKSNRERRAVEQERARKEILLSGVKRS